MPGEITSVEDREEFRASVRGFLARRAPMAEVRRLMATEDGFDEAVWLEAAEQLGLQSLAIPEEFGGAGVTVVEQGVALEELGRALFTGPYLSSAVLATQLVLQSSDEEVKGELLPELVAGTTRIAVAVAERSWEQGLERPGATALASGDGWLLTGAKRLVVDGVAADRLIVTAATPQGPSLFLVDAAAAGIRRTAVPVVDLTRKQAEVSFDAAPARLIGAEGDARPVLRRAVDLAIAALAAEQVGAAERALEITVDYLKVREQFGRVLAGFQALKHRVANLLAEVEVARALAEAALRAGALEDWDELDTLAALAKVRSWEVLDHVGAESVQLHGGVGFTWEFDPHLYFKRAKGAQFLFGDPSTYRERAAANIGL